MTWVFAQLAPVCHGCASTVPGVQALGFGWGGEGMRRNRRVEAGGVRGDVAACPILRVPRPAECGLADLWEPINASPNAGKEERLSCNPYWLPCALSANLYHGFVPLNDVLLSSSPTLIHNIISFQYSPNYSSSDLNGNGMNEKNSNKQTNIYSQTWSGNNRVNSIDVIVKSLVLSSQNKCEMKHQTHRAAVCREKEEILFNFGRFWLRNAWHPAAKSVDYSELPSGSALGVYLSQNLRGDKQGLI